MRRMFLLTSVFFLVLTITGILLVRYSDPHNSGKGDRIDIKINRKDEKTILMISDNGPGISDTVIKKIFEPFFTTKKFEEGTGLGLSICRNIVRAHGGDITVNSIEGQGSVFSIELPYQKF